MSALWAAAIIAAIGVTGSILAIIWRGGQLLGEVRTAIRQLTMIASDHERRMRSLERRPRDAAWRDVRERRHGGSG